MLTSFMGEKLEPNIELYDKEKILELFKFCIIF